MTSFSKGFALLLLALASSATVACNDYPPAESAEGNRDQILVVGVGKMTAKPDIATIHIGVENRAASVAEASQQNNDQMARLIAALKGVQIAEKDIRTSNFSINFERSEDYPPHPTPMAAPPPSSAPAAPPPPAGGKKAPAKAGAAAGGAAVPMPSGPVQQVPQVRGFYRVSNTVQIIVRDLSKIGHVLDTAVATGANNVHGVNFELEDDKAIQGKLRERAVADAAERASSLAKLGHLELGDVRSISEVIGNRGGGMMVPMAAMDFAKGGAPIEAGELTFEGRIEIVYAIKR